VESLSVGIVGQLSSTFQFLKWGVLASVLANLSPLAASHSTFSKHFSDGISLAAIATEGFQIFREKGSWQSKSVEKHDLTNVA